MNEKKKCKSRSGVLTIYIFNLPLKCWKIGNSRQTRIIIKLGKNFLFFVIIIITYLFILYLTLTLS